MPSRRPWFVFITVAVSLLAGMGIIAPAVPAQAADPFVVDNFEAGLPAGQDANNVAIGFNTFRDPNSTVAISTTAVPPAPVPGSGNPNNVLKMDVNVVSFAGFAHSLENAAVDQWVSQDWSAYEGISFWLYGNNSGTTLFVDVLDNRNPGSTRDDAERWSVDFPDNFSGWKKIELPFASMKRKEIGNGAPNDGFGLTEVRGWALGTITTPSPQTYYVDDLTLYGTAPVRPLTVGFSAINYRVTEGTAAVVTVKLSKPFTSTVTVNFATTFGPAIANRDYTPVTGTLTFPANSTEQSFDVPTINDAKYQGERGVQVELSAPTGGAALGLPPVARVTIQDDEVYFPPLLDDFETHPYLWSADDNVQLSNPEIAAGTPMALPGQGAYEHVLQVDQTSGSGPYEFGRQFPEAQDWSNATGLSFWYYGRNSGENISVRLTNNQVITDDPANAQLVWSDEFNTPDGTAPDSRVWGNEIGDGTAIGNPGWGNDELEFYTNSTDNAATDGNGNLVITVKEADGTQQCYYGPCKYTSARLLTKNRFEVAYGRVEARIKVPRGAGLWPAFWMLGTDIDRVNWPQTGEIDIMENVGRLPNQVFGTLHGPGYSGGQSYGRIVDLGKPVADDFHTIAVDWQPNKVVWYLDGELFFTATPDDAFLQGKQWVYNHPFFMILNVAVGGNFGGAVGAETTFPQQMLVDYVRLYQAQPDPVQFETAVSDTFVGWKKITVPFTAFQGEAGQTLDRSAIQSISFQAPGNHHLYLPLVNKTSALQGASVQAPGGRRDAVAVPARVGPGVSSPTILLDQLQLYYDDTTPPTVAITSSAAGSPATGPVTFTLTFSEDVGSSFTADDIAVTGGTAGTFNRISGTLATQIVTPPLNATGTFTVSVAAGSFSDAAYNTNTVSASAEQAYNTVGVGGGWSAITFDASAVTYTLTGFGGAENSTVVVDPTDAGNMVARVVKSGTAELWAGTTVSTGPNLSVPRLPFTASDTRMTVRVWSPDAGIPVRLKVEDAADGTHSVETEATTTVANAWETLTFDFANQATGTAALNLAFTYDKASIFFNFGVTGATAGEKTYYFDDVAFVPSGDSWSTITFDESAVTYTLTGFGGAENSTVVVDPAGGTNNVARVVKSATAELWAGTTVSTGPNFSVPQLPFTASDTRMTVRIWSPDAGIPVRLKVEDAADGTHSVETEATTTVANAWETLTFDFANQAAGTQALNLAFTYDKASIFFNFGVTGATAGEKTYYFDDVAFVP